MIVKIIFRSRDYEKSVKSMIQASYTPVIREVPC